MHRYQSSNIEHRSTVRTFGITSIDLVLPSGRRNPREFGADASHRRAIFADSFLRQSKAVEGARIFAVSFWGSREAMRPGTVIEPEVLR